MSDDSKDAGDSHPVKSIVLFSDGTGNSSGKLFKTNVWRMYEAIDLGPAPPGMRDQIAYYDNGVGTSGFHPIRIVQGVFGWGLRRNALEIYRYVCRNYRPGDQIYGFGYSRGAFTMRLVMDMIASQGVVPYRDERQLARAARAVYATYRKSEPLGWRAPLVQLVRASTRLVTSSWRRLRGARRDDAPPNHRPAICFLGVWDTVAAYGGPITEVTRAFDNWVYPLSIPSYQLHPNIECARHALALDDERDSFHPLLWDEIHEEERVERKAARPGRIQQVWFAGMHGDVGGGYPDESLSFVSLLWMLEEAEKCGLRTLDIVIDRYRALVNSAGPMHDSRAGFGAYYRYQPRNTAIWLETEDKSVLSQRDPSIRDDAGNRRGLIREVKVHESVIARIANGTDSYAPLVLPDRFRVVGSGKYGEARQQDEAAVAAPRKAATTLLSSMDKALLPRIDRSGIVTGPSSGAMRLWDLVWQRRILYFMTLLATIALLLIPTWGHWQPADRSGFEAVLPSDGRDWLANIVRLPMPFLPTFTHGWIEGFARYPGLFFGLFFVILFLLRYNGRLDQRIQDAARGRWHEALSSAGPATEAPDAPSLIHKLRTSGPYQRGLWLLKWHVFPLLFGLAILLVALWIALIVTTQLRLPAMEADLGRCQTGNGRMHQAIGIRQADFETARTCNAEIGHVVRDTRYVVTFDVVDEWTDGGHRTTPQGASAGMLGVPGLLGAPLRRVINASYLQPLVAIREDPSEGTWSIWNYFRSPVYIHALELRPVPDVPNRYSGEFVARRDGELFLFANDAVLPYRLDAFYAGRWGANRGTACVTIRTEDATDPPAGEMGPICLRFSTKPAEDEDGSAAPDAATGPAR
ncbi:MAG: DUF2235 domain-containing protein [Sphingomonas sp.]|nr:DUF2235 domain-containing protein [Sphingomonas sp.]